MYKITLYPEYSRNRHRSKIRMVRFSLLAFLLGLELLVVSSHALSLVIIRDETKNLHNTIKWLTAREGREIGSVSNLDVAREILSIREQRIDWSPKLAALSENIRPTLLLDYVSGRASGERQTACLEIRGGIKGNGRQLEEISSFIEQIREDHRVSEDFPNIELGALKGEENGNFRVRCEPREGTF